MKISLTTLLTILSTSVSIGDVNASENDHTKEDWKFTVSFLMEKMPTAKSDMSISTDASSGKMYLIGGCDHEDGNTYKEDYDTYLCTSITSENLSFDPSLETDDPKFTKLRSAPRDRYRHTSALLNEKIYLIGGRDVDDNIISELDIYDIATDTWSSTLLDNNTVTSDLASFVYDDFVYYFGGYTIGYNATREVYRFDTRTVSIDEVVSSEHMENLALLEERGDIHAVTHSNKVFIAGGFSHIDYFAQPLKTVEVLSLTNMAGWEKLPSLNIGRGDKALVASKSYLFAIGGEGKSGSDTEAFDEVEVLSFDHDNDHDNDHDHDYGWLNLGSMPNERFRFVAATDTNEENTIYAFGGQKYYDQECNCYPTSDVVSRMVYEVNGGNTIINAVRLWSGITVSMLFGLILM